ncbi:MAG: hypothetical protein IPL63_11520 [Saprospiraceae bacterium]|nr:hypothetical protein [Saprospiraceae bacterium]MBK6567023.1 hypothetical protein [Saprospiraceae bacterium]MBK7525126.1 hypothetical protein [Saprospiraceae bacterium]MBK8547965.1 hypothetical protein [Saprospiraceae bacterium]MBK8855074.1 hypothetical protein [Saprospiraceae bacterium]
MQRIHFFIIIVFFQLPLYSQNISDVVRWSTMQPAGTATSLGVNNAIGAIGGDIMAASFNPAGIAEFKKSNFTFSGGFEINDNNSFLAGDAATTNRLRSTKFGLNNIGFVIGNYRPNKNFTSSNFAIGFSKTANFKDKILYNGKTEGTITEYFSEKANSLSVDELDDFAAFPAYNTGAIFDFDGDKNYETDFAEEDLLVKKQQNINRRGSVNELSFTWAGDYKNKFNIGIGVGIPFVNFSEGKVYIESDPDGEIATFNRLKYIEDLSITGAGFNAKIGIQAKPFSWFRIGGAFHTPTWFTLEDTYTTSLEYSYDNETNVYPGNDDDIPQLQFKYNLSNPWKAIGSVGSVFNLGQVSGFVNFDVEYIDYVSAEYDGTAYSDAPGEIEYTNELNRNILNSFESRTNYRLGAELAYDTYRVRGGYYQFQSPFINETNKSESFSVGAGFRGEKFYLDFAIQFSEQASGYNAYTVTKSSRDPLVNVDKSRTLALVTMGFKL